MKTVQNVAAAAAETIHFLQDHPHLIPLLDIDGVMLCADHRISFKPCGAFDLEAYRRDSTPENIALDVELDFAAVGRWLTKHGRPFGVATARIYCADTAKRLCDLGVMPSHVISREGDSDHRTDHVLKIQGIEAMFDPADYGDLILIDDLHDNCLAAVELGCLAVHVASDQCYSLKLRG